MTAPCRAEATAHARLLAGAMPARRATAARRRLLATTFALAAGPRPGRGSACWAGGYDPFSCCHPKFGPHGRPECFDEVFTAARCCDQSGWGEREVVFYHQALQISWSAPCPHAIDDWPDHWRGAAWQEVLFWWYHLQTPQQRAASSRRPEEQPLNEELRGLASQPSGRGAASAAAARPPKLRLLDVGSGPVNLIGRSWPGVDVEVVFADPLACYYNLIRHDLGVPPFDMAGGIHAVGAERLTAEFGEGAFDLVHCANALDHSHDPMVGVEEILRVVRVGRPVVLRHKRNEGLANNYSGLHQWNFDARAGRLVIWRPEELTVIDVEARLVESKLIEPGAVEVEVLQTAELPWEVVRAVIWRREEPDVVSET